MYSNQIEPSREERSSISSELVKCKSREAKCRISLLLHLQQEHLNFCIVRLTVYSAPPVGYQTKNQAMFMERDGTLRLLLLHFTTSDCYRDISSPHPHPRKYRCRAGRVSGVPPSISSISLSLSLSSPCNVFLPSLSSSFSLFLPRQPTVARSREMSRSV